MRTIVRRSGREFDETVAQVVAAELLRDGRVNVSLTGGSSPKGAYRLLTQELAGNPCDYDQVHYYGFDNLPFPPYEYGFAEMYVGQDLYSPAGIPPERVHHLTNDNYRQFSKEIDDAGGLDLLLLGLGADGHFCGNLPGHTDFNQDFYLYKASQVEGLAELLDNCGWDGSPLPEFGVTMGAAGAMKARKVVVIVNGKHKAEAVRTLLSSPITEAFPASALKLHPNALLILDTDAASLL